MSSNEEILFKIFTCLAVLALRTVFIVVAMKLFNYGNLWAGAFFVALIIPVANE